MTTQEPTVGVVNDRYRMEPGLSQFTAQAFAGGLLSFMAHSPTFTVRGFEGELRWRPDAAEPARLVITVRADSLDLLDKVRPADRAEIEDRMRREVLEVAAHPTIQFESNEIRTDAVAADRYRLGIRGTLSLHGVANPEAIEAELHRFHDGVRLVGEFPLWLSAYRIRPVTAVGGSIRLQDQLRVSFDVGARKEAS